MKSIACLLLRIAVYVLEFTISVFLFPIGLMQALSFILEEARYTLSSTPSEARGGESVDGDGDADH